MAAPPLILVLGAPGTGPDTITQALRTQFPASAVRVAAGDAVLSALLAGDTEGAVQALDAHGPVALTLLMGLDQPPAAADVRDQIDAQLRSLLQRAARPFQVIYGAGRDRERNACTAANAIFSIANSLTTTSGSSNFESKTRRMRAWSCEKCSDPVCEHRLFTALTGRERPAG